MLPVNSSLLEALLCIWHFNGNLLNSHTFWCLPVSFTNVLLSSTFIKLMLRGVFVSLTLSVWLNCRTLFFSLCTEQTLHTKKTSICKEDFVQPKSIKDHSQIQRNPLGHLTVFNQAFLAGDSKLLNSSVCECSMLRPLNMWTAIYLNWIKSLSCLRRFFSAASQTQMCFILAK